MPKLYMGREVPGDVALETDDSLTRRKGIGQGCLGVVELAEVILSSPCDTECVAYRR